MVRRPTGHLWRDSVKSQNCEIKSFNKNIDHLDRVALVDPVTKAFREQSRLPAIPAFNKALHPIPRSSRITPRSESQPVFLPSQALYRRHGVKFASPRSADQP